MLYKVRGAAKRKNKTEFDSSIAALESRRCGDIGIHRLPV